MAKETRSYKVAQAYFKNVLALERKIQFLEAEIEKQRARLDISGIDYSDIVNGSRKSDQMFEGICQLSDYIEELNTDLVGYVEERENARKVLDHISDTAAYEVLRYRYFEGYRFKDIVKVLGYSEPRLYELHREGIMKLFVHVPLEHRM